MIKSQKNARRAQVDKASAVFKKHGGWTWTFTPTLKPNK
jgi:hypothetical protein